MARAGAGAGARIGTLDGCRALAIGLVLAYHLFRTRGFPSPPLLVPWMRWLGELGVRVFFVISGYLITTLLLRELAATGSIALGRFYFRRALRLFPAFYLFLGTVALLSAFGVLSLHPGDLRAAATYTMNYHPDPSWWLVHCWSLAIEEQFYLLWPAVLVLFGRRRGLGLAAAFVLAAPLVRLATWQLFPQARTGVHDLTFGTIGDAVATGCLLAGLGDRLEAWRAYLRFLDSPAALLAPALVVGAYVLSALSWRIHLSVGPSALNLGIAVCLDFCLRHPRAIASRLLQARPLATIGVGSYSLYLWQELFLNRHAAGPLQAFPLNLACAAVAAAGSYFLVERPSLRLRARAEARLFPAAAKEPTAVAARPL